MSESKPDNELILEKLALIESKLDINNRTVQRLNSGAAQTEDKLADWSKLLSNASNLSFGIVALVYVVGFFIVNSYLSQYGNYTLALLQSQYLATGILVLLLVGIFVVSELIFTGSRWLKVQWWRTTISATDATCVLIVLSFILNNRNVVNLLIAFIPFILLLVGSNMAAIFLGGWVWESKGERIVMHPIRSGIGVAILTITLLVGGFGFLYLFSGMTYPLVRPEFGGGAAHLVQFYGTTDEVAKLQSYGIPLTKTVQANTILAQNVISPTYTIPVYLLGETSDSYIVTDMASEPRFDILVPRSRFGLSFQIPKDQVSGVLFLSRRDTGNPLVALGYALAIFLIIAVAGILGERILFSLMRRVIQ